LGSLFATFLAIEEIPRRIYLYPKAHVALVPFFFPGSILLRYGAGMLLAVGLAERADAVSYQRSLI
jgi:hypothetical protein